MLWAIILMILGIFERPVHIFMILIFIVDGEALLAALNWVSLVGHPSLPNNPTGQDLMAQPNPAREAVLVSGNLSAQSTYRLVDTRGRAWREGPAAPMFRIDLQGMPPSVYVVMAWDPERQTSHTTRVVKTH